jgi:hypothetical protein
MGAVEQEHHMKSMGNLDRVNPVFADDADPGAVAFAKAYLAANRGSRRPTGPTERDEAAAKAFRAAWKSVSIRAGFAGSGTAEYTGADGVFTVDRRANGRTFWGTDTWITRKA